MSSQEWKPKSLKELSIFLSMLPMDLRLLCEKASQDLIQSMHKDHYRSLLEDLFLKMKKIRTFLDNFPQGFNKLSVTLGDFVYENIYDERWGPLRLSKYDHSPGWVIGA